MKDEKHCPRQSDDATHEVKYCNKPRTASPSDPRERHGQRDEKKNAGEAGNRIQSRNGKDKTERNRPKQECQSEVSDERRNNQRAGPKHLHWLVCA